MRVLAPVVALFSLISLSIAVPIDAPVGALQARAYSPSGSNPSSGSSASSGSNTSSSSNSSSGTPSTSSADPSSPAGGCGVALNGYSTCLSAILCALHVYCGPKGS